MPWKWMSSGWSQKMTFYSVICLMSPGNAFRMLIWEYCVSSSCKDFEHFQAKKGKVWSMAWSVFLALIGIFSVRRSKRRSRIHFGFSYVIGWRSTMRWCAFFIHLKFVMRLTVVIIIRWYKAFNVEVNLRMGKLSKDLFLWIQRAFLLNLEIWLNAYTL